MQNLHNSVIRLLPLVACLLFVSVSYAGQPILWDTTITSISVNGGADSANPGTTCILVANPVTTSCTSGYVAILNNNKQLLSAAMLAKSSGSKIALYYEDTSATQHCPGLVFTPCTVISIILR